MKSLFGRSRVVAAVVFGIALTACNAVEDVDPKPSTPVPAQQAVLGGTVTGLGSRRPIILQNNGDSANAQPFFGISGQNTVLFTFGSQQVGTPYNITVKTAPFGKVCTVANGTGTIGDANAAPITVTCTNDPAVPRYNVTVQVQAAASQLAGLKVRLTTEEGVLEQPASGQTSVTFTGAVFSPPLANPPIFFYYASAYVPDADGTSVDNCAVSQSTNDIANPVSPSGNVGVATGQTSGPIVTSCRFTIGGNVGYSQPSGVTYTAQTITGLQLGLKDMSGVTNSAYIYDVPSTTLAAATTTSAFTFGGSTPTQFVANPKALYEMYVTRQPTSGQYCIVTNTTAITGSGNGNGSIVNLVSTSSISVAFANITNLAVRCRARPATASNPGVALSGVYQTTGVASTATVTAGSTTTVTQITAGTANAGGLGTTRTVTATVVSNGVPTVTITTQTLATQADDRRFLSFFDDGTFLYGIHSSATFNSSASNNLEHGFYYYNPTAQTISFTIITDANGATNAAQTLTSGPAGLSDTPGYVSPTASATSVVKSNTANDITSGSRHTLTMTFCATTPTNSCPPNAASNIQVWSMTEPVQTLSTLTGAWVTPDHERLFVYDFNKIAGFHVGANGQDNMQDGCYVYDDPTIMSGYFVRRGGGTAVDPNNPLVTNCNLGANLATSSSPDVPNANTAPALLTGFIGRLPGSKSVIDNRPPSPTNFAIVPGTADQSTPDQVTIQNTLNGTLVDYPVTFVRARINN